MVGADLEDCSRPRGFLAEFAELWQIDGLIGGAQTVPASILSIATTFEPSSLATCGAKAAALAAVRAASNSNGLVEERALVGAVCEQLLQKRKQAKERGQQKNSSVAILNIGGMHDGMQQQSLDVDENVSLLALDLLSSPKDCLRRTQVDRCAPPFFGAFHALTVDNAGGRAGLAAGLLATRFVKRAVHTIQGAIIDP